VRTDLALPAPYRPATLGQRERRLAAAALGLSLAAHLAGLGLLPDWRPGAPSVPPSIHVTLLAPPPSPPATPAPAPAVPVPKTQAQPMAKAQARVVYPAPAAILVRPEPAPTAPRVARPASSPASAAAAEAPSIPAVPASAQLAVVAANPPSAAEPAPVAVDPSLLARYRDTLSSLLSRQQQYPRLAAARGWEGDVVLKLVIARKGQLVAARVLHSSGYAVLDEHALALVAEVQPFPALPGQLAGDDLEVTVPVHYQLKRG